ncbi:MAG: asparagine synthase (glutamine-hydrolyzing) [Clostridia bacterium]|nr:asparagine synthase (glutamine-hydrolyzing) [Clostridia bacterium]MBP3495643.1 asparagine synthase (glutamine-hydrolyzing) [Clostridia bacterium]
MCSICGEISFLNPCEVNPDVVSEMSKKMKHRGPDESDIFLDKGVALAHNRLSVIDIENGHQPMSVVYGNKKYTIVYNGEIYNTEEIKKDLKRKGIFLKTNCDTEIVLYAYILYGESAPCMLNGIFAFCVYDGEKAFFARDHFGVKPLYYSKKGSSLIFASEIKAMLAHPKITSDVTKEGLWEVIYLSPNFVSGKSVFKDILELSPAECMIFDKNGIKKWKYWQVNAMPYFKDRDYAVEKTRELVSSAVKMQLGSDVGLCVLLSGGLDSSVVSAIASKEYKKNGKVLSTYSFEYEGNKESFENSLFQPERDDEFATYLADYLGTNHTVLTCPTTTLAENLTTSAYYRDLPGQADIDSSLLYFCKEIKKNHTVGLSGECSDEIFGGYPWFYRPEMLYSDFFPWIHAPRLRPSLFKDSVSNSDEGYEYIREIYKKSLRECPTLPSDTPEMKNSRVASYLSVNYFMTSLLQRKDRMSMASGVEIRVPFADHRIYEFLYNVPWEIKFEGGVEKALLRNSMKEYLPERILWRKKSPYPKTHNPEYLKLVLKMLNERLRSSHYLKECLDMNKVNEVVGTKKTWFGQLMSDAQLIAWLIQLDYWLENNKINII